MRLFKTAVVTLLTVVLLGMMAAPIAAQTDETAGTDFNDLDGLQRAYSRSYTADFMTMFAVGTPDAMPSGWFVLTGMVLEFDNEDNAKAGNEQLMAEIEGGDLTEGDSSVEDAELDVDFDYTAKQAVEEEDGMTTHVLVATAQDGKYVYAAVGVTFGDDPADVVSSLLTSMKDADTDGGAGEFHQDGTSEGGLWSKLPSLEQAQELSESFIEAADEVLYPESEATPAA